MNPCIYERQAGVYNPGSEEEGVGDKGRLSHGVQGDPGR